MRSIASHTTGTRRSTILGTITRFTRTITTLLRTAWAGGTDPNPLDYPVLFATLSNGQGFTTEKSGLGFPRGGQVDNRLQGYVGDSWRMYPNLTLTLGVHYLRDTGRVDSDLKAIP